MGEVGGDFRRGTAGEAEEEGEEKGDGDGAMRGRLRERLEEAGGLGERSGEGQISFEGEDCLIAVEARESGREGLVVGLGVSGRATVSFPASSESSSGECWVGIWSNAAREEDEDAEGEGGGDERRTRRDSSGCVSS